MIDYDHWIARIDNDLQLQKDLQEEFWNEKFTRRELIELRTVFNAIKEFEANRN